MDSWADASRSRNGLCRRPFRADGQGKAAQHPPEDEKQREQERENKAAHPAFHGSGYSWACSADGAARRLTRAARYPAPKPLSMLTTATPGAQLFSIASNAASPSKLAP